MFIQRNIALCVKFIILYVHIQTQFQWLQQATDFLIEPLLSRPQTVNKLPSHPCFQLCEIIFDILEMKFQSLCCMAFEKL